MPRRVYKVAIVGGSMCALADVFAVVSLLTPSWVVNDFLGEWMKAKEIGTHYSIDCILNMQYVDTYVWWQLVKCMGPLSWLTASLPSKQIYCTKYHHEVLLLFILYIVIKEQHLCIDKENMGLQGLSDDSLLFGCIHEEYLRGVNPSILILCWYFEHKHTELFLCSQMKRSIRIIINTVLNPISFSIQSVVHCFCSFTGETMNRINFLKYYK